MADVTAASLRWGILGAGTAYPSGHMIAHRFARGVAASATGGLLAIASRSREKAEQFGATFGVPRRYGSYEALLDDPDIQAVYIALPNHLHAEWSIKCARAGKHILCEKPLTLNVAQAMVVLEEVRSHDVFLMEAFMYRCHPQTKRLKRLIEEGVIGEVRLIEAAFSYDLGPHYANVRLSNAMGGGGIMDVGCYTMSMARLIAGAEPIKVTGVATVGERSLVDEVAAAAVHFPNSIVANLICGLGAEMDHTLRIWGARGSIVVPEPWLPGTGPSRIVVRATASSEPEEILIEGGHDLYALEADTVARHIAARQAPEVSWEDTLGNMAALDLWRQAAGVTFNAERPEALRASAPARPAHAPMRYGSIPGVKQPISRLLMGTVSFTQQQQLPLVYALLDHFVSLGGNAIDTAHQYGRGVAERSIGRWMASRGIRDEIVIVSKCCREEVLGRGLRVNPAAITSDLADSLERLQTDYIDIYLLHTDDPAYPVGPLVECLNGHRRAGSIRAFGASNWSAARLQAANDYAREQGLVPFVAGSPQFSLAVWRESPWPGCLSAAVEGKDWYARHQFPLIAWSSQAQGFFTGRFAPEDRSDAEMMRCWYTSDNFERLERARELGRRKGGVSTNAIALAYVLSQPFPTFAVIGPRTIEELRTSATALPVHLTPEEVAWLNLESQSLPPDADHA